MKKNIILILLLIIFTNSKALSSDLKKVYFAGGCFWCMEESFDKINGVVSSISGYSGGTLKNPTYKDVIFKDTGHVETIEITYDPKIVSYKKLLNTFWKNIDPFDQYGQFCDKGKSYRSVIFYQNKKQKVAIEKSLKEIEDRFNSEVFTLIWSFKEFYKAENYHQDYYQKNFLRYLSYKKACQREEVLKKVWN
ncbi:MAG: peptide-methionine (S)-S-oxide reductase MsrA [Pelagibacteraceae bacterium]